MLVKRACYPQSYSSSCAPGIHHLPLPTWLSCASRPPVRNSTNVSIVSRHEPGRVEHVHASHRNVHRHSSHTHTQPLALWRLHDEVRLLPVTNPVSTSTASANAHDKQNRMNSQPHAQQQLPVRGLHALPVLDSPSEERRALVRLLRLKDLVLPVDARLELAALDELYDLPARWRTIRTPGSCAGAGSTRTAGSTELAPCSGLSSTSVLISGRGKVAKPSAPLLEPLASRRRSPVILQLPTPGKSRLPAPTLPTVIGSPRQTNMVSVIYEDGASASTSARSSCGLDRQHGIMEGTSSERGGCKTG